MTCCLRLSPRIEHDLDAVVLFLEERVVSIGRVLQRQSVRDDHAGIDVALLDVLEQLWHVLVHVRLPHAERQAFAESRAEWEVVEESAINARNGNDSALAARLNTLPQSKRPIEADAHHLLGAITVPVDAVSVRFHANSVDARIRTSTAGEFLQRLDQVWRLRVVHHFSARILRKPQTLRNIVDGNDFSRSEQLCTVDRELSDRSTTPNGNYLTAFDIAVLGRHVASWEDVAQEQDLLVIEIALNL